MARRPILRIARILGFGLLALVAVVLGLLLHLDTASGRRALARFTTLALRKTLSGQVTLESVRRAGLSGLELRGLVLRDVQGRPVLEVDRVGISLNIPSALRNLTGRISPSRWRLDHVRAESVTVRLIPETGSSTPTLLRALTPPSESAAAPSSPSSTEVHILNIELGSAHVHSSLPGVLRAAAELRNVRGSLLSTPVETALDISQGWAELRPAAAPRGRGMVGLSFRSPGRLFATWNGYLEETQVATVVQIDGSQVHAELELPRVASADARRMFPAWPLYTDAAARLEARGPWPELDINGEISSGVTKVRTRGRARLEPTTHITAEVQAENLDLSALRATPFQTSLDLSAKLELGETRGVFELKAEGTTEPTIFQGEELPGSEFSVRAAGTELGGRVLLREPGLPVNLSFSSRPNGEVEIVASSPRVAAERVPRLRKYLGPIRGELELDARAQIGQGQFRGELASKLWNLDYRALGLGSAELSAESHGSLSELSAARIKARLSGERLATPELGFEKLALELSGPLLNPTLHAELLNKDGLNLVLSAAVHPGERALLDAVELELRRDHLTLFGRVARFELDGANLALKGVKLQGAPGSLQGAFEQRKGSLTLEARAENFDLTALGQLLGLPQKALSGRATIDADWVSAADLDQGHVHFQLDDISVARWSGISATGRAELEQRHFTGELTLSAAQLGRMNASWNSELRGRTFRSDTWRKLTGNADIRIDGAELSELPKFIALPERLQSLRGEGFARLLVERTQPDGFPDTKLLVGTRGLDLSIKNTAPEAPIHFQGFDAMLGAYVSGATGDGEFTLELRDPSGHSTSTSAKLRLDLERALRSPAEFWDAILRAPVFAKLIVPERPIESIPEPVRLGALAGSLRAEATLLGTLAEPVIAVRAEARQLRPAQSRFAEALDLCLSGNYDSSQRQLGGQLSAFLPSSERCAGARVATVSGTARLPAPPAPAAFWSGLARLDLTGLPLNTLPGLADARLTGKAFGSAELTRDRLQPRLRAELTFRDARIEDTPLGDSQLSIALEQGALLSSFQAQQSAGQINAQLSAGLDFDKTVLPQLDPARPVRAEIVAREAEARVLEPLLDDVFDSVRGRMSGQLSLVSVANASSPEQPWHSEFSGQLALKGGELQIAELGLGLKDVSLDARTLRQGPHTVVQVRNLTAKARTARPNLSASADLYFQGLRVASGRANVNVRGLPLVLDGVTYGSASGKASLELTHETDKMAVTVRLPELTAELPRSSARNLHPDEENPDITVLQPLAEPQEKSSSDTTQAWQLQFELGPSVRVTRSDFSLPVNGAPELWLGARTELKGAVQLQAGGHVNLFGKAFTIEGGALYFDTGEPQNPRLGITASWRAPDGTNVYIEATGTYRDPNIHFYSDPSKAQPEILALLIGGAGVGNSSAAAAPLGYGADFLGALLAGTPLESLEFRTSTEKGVGQTSYSTYTAAYPLSDTLWFEGSYKALGTTQPWQRRYDLSGTLDFRFQKNWSLRTEVGGLGGGMDVLWNYRY